MKAPKLQVVFKTENKYLNLKLFQKLIYSMDIGISYINEKLKRNYKLDCNEKAHFSRISRRDYATKKKYARFIGLQ